MGSNAVLTLFCFILSVNCAFNFTDLVSLTAELCKSHQVQNIVLFYNNKTSKASEINQFQQLLHTEIVVATFLLSLPPKTALRDLVDQPTISYVFLKNMNDDILQISDAGLIGIHISKIIFIMRKPAAAKSAKKLFKWCWARGMVNVLLLFIEDKDDGDNSKLQIYSYQPFPEIILENVTTLSSTNFFPDRLKNFQGYCFQSPVRQDAPRVFKYRNIRGERVYAGIGPQIFLNFVDKLNATFQEIIMPNETSHVDILGILSMIDKKEIDVSIHPYGNFDRKVYGASYPFLPTHWCFVVPVIREVPAFMYLILPFDGIVWCTIIAGILYISLVKHLSSVKCRKQSEFGQVLGDILCGTLYITIPIKYPSCSIHNSLFYGQLMLLGFILSNLYLSSLTSFLAATLYGPQMNTVEDIYQAGLKIMTIKFETSSIVGQENFPPKYTPILDIVDPDTLAKHRNSLNTSYGYPMTTDRWEFFLQQQRYLETPILRVSDVCFGHYHLAFPLQYDSPFIEPLSNFINQVSEHGLYYKWQATTFDQAVRSNMLHILRSPESNSKALTVTHLTLLWAIYGVGITGSIICFGLEHVFYKFFFSH